MSAHPSITVAPNGARRDKAEHPAIPLTRDEIVAAAQACEAAGASILHLHVRDADGRHSLDPALYAETIAALRDASALIVQPTTERAGRFGPAEMMAVQRKLKPEMISLNLSELLDADTPEEQVRARDFLLELADAGTVPQYIVYSPAELRRLQNWWEDGWLPQAEPWLLIVLGRYTQAPSAPRDLLPFLPLLPERWRWGVCAFGPHELGCVTTAALLGGHCRVGFENNLLSAEGKRLGDNAEQVAALAKVLHGLGLPAAAPVEVRAEFGLVFS